MRSINKIMCLMTLLLFVISLASCNGLRFEHYTEQNITKYIDLSDGGTVIASITVDSFDGSDGSKYIELLSVSYSVVNSAEFKNIYVEYSDGENTYQETSDQFDEAYEVDGEKVLYEDNEIKASMVIYMENGEKETVELP